jgi:pimeloyl-ACP methyl ester carboxylesterase
MNELVFKTAGKGFPLVLVHGYLAGADIWQEQLEFFKDHFKVIVPNLPGFADSAQVTAPNSIIDIANLLLSELTNRGVDKFHLMGHSMGGMIVQAMAAIAPDRIDHLICYGTGPVGVLPDRFETIEQSRDRLNNDGLEKTVKRIAATWFLHREDAEGYDQCVKLGLQANMQAALASLTAWENWDGREELKNIRAKTLIIWGESDRSYNQSQPEALWHGIENSCLVVVSNCAHNVHMEKPIFFNAIVKDFLPTQSN